MSYRMNPRQSCFGYAKKFHRAGHTEEQLHEDEEANITSRTNGHVRGTGSSAFACSQTFLRVCCRQHNILVTVYTFHPTIAQFNKTRSCAPRGRHLVASFTPESLEQRTSLRMQIE